MTATEIINPVDAREVRAWLAAVTTTFLGEPDGDEFDGRVQAWLRDWHPDRVWGVQDRGRWVATLASLPRTITVPGPLGRNPELAVDALSAVTVNATHRRRGLLTAMITDALQAARRRGDPFSILISAEWPIYGRFGYSPATQVAEYTLFPRTSGGLVADPGRGAVRQVEAAELGVLAPAVFERARERRAGQVDRAGSWWPRQLGLDGYRTAHRGPRPTSYLVHDAGAGPDGLLWWAPTRDADLPGHLGAITVVGLVAATDAAYRGLFDYLLGLDIVEEITLPRRPVDEPVRWLLRDGRSLRQTGVLDDVWIRLLDVPAALAARYYPVPGTLVLEVRDEDGGFAAGRFRLHAEDGAAQCHPTRDSADLRVDHRSLASIYLGAISPAQLALTGQLAELRPGALGLLQAMFSTALPPWNATGF